LSVSLASAGTLVKTFKKVLGEKINESSGRETQPARPPEHAEELEGTTPLPLVWATPYLPVAVGPTYPVVEAVPMPGSL
jgi:hypothetical protein